MKLCIYWKSGRSSSVKLAQNVFGDEFAEQHSYMHPSVLNRIVFYFNCEYLSSLNLCSAACALGYYIAHEAKAEELYDFVDAPYSHENTSVLYIGGKKLEFQDMDKKELVTAVNDERLNLILQRLQGASWKFGEHYKDTFSIKYMLGKRFGFFDIPDEERHSIVIRRMYTPFTASSFIVAAYKGIVSIGLRVPTRSFRANVKTTLSTLAAEWCICRAGR